MSTIKPDEYIPLWELQQSERQTIRIKRMVFLGEERDFISRKKLRQQISQNNKGDSDGLTKDEQYKKNQEKFFLNADIKNFEGQWFRSGGFSIFRYQIEDFISALQNICDGEYDNDMEFKISQLLDKKIKSGFSINEYNQWKNHQDPFIKKQIWQMEEMGMDKKDIRKALDPASYTDD